MRSKYKLWYLLPSHNNLLCIFSNILEYANLVQPHKPLVSPTSVDFSFK